MRDKYCTRGHDVHVARMRITTWTSKEQLLMISHCVK